MRKTIMFIFKRVSSVMVYCLILGFLLAVRTGLGQNPQPAQVFYVPFPEDEALQILYSIASKGGFISGDYAKYTPVNPMTSYTSIALMADNTVIYYDHWENGYDADIANPVNVFSGSNPGGTQIWGDGDPSNGYPPGYPLDILHAGDVIVLEDSVNVNSRGSTIYFDGNDKIASSKSIAVTRATWASGSKGMFAMANEVYDTSFFGTEFIMPVGENISGNTKILDYVGAFIMAGPGGATVGVDLDGNGSVDVQKVLAEGESFKIDGGFKLGGTINATGPIQVEVITADPSSWYGSRSFRLFSCSDWSSSYTSPVSTRKGTRDSTAIWLYNPNESAIDVDYITRTTSGLVTNNITINAKSHYRQVVPFGSDSRQVGSRFIAPGGERFYGVVMNDAVDTTGGQDQNTTFDWGFTMVPDELLSQQVLIGLGLGRDPTSATKPNQNGSPVWVTTVGNGNVAATVYIDYDGDPATGAFQDEYGSRYDKEITLKELELELIYNPSGDQAGMLIYTFDEGVSIVAAWGQDPQEADGSEPGLDLGTGIPPFPLYEVTKSSSLVVDSDGDGYTSPGDVIEYVVKIENIGRQPVTDLVISDILPDAVRYEVLSTRFVNHDRVSSDISDRVGEGLDAFPLAGEGYELNEKENYLPVGDYWEVIYQVKMKDYNELPTGTVSLNNLVQVSGSSSSTTNSLNTPIFGQIGDYVWYDVNQNGLQDGDEVGVAGALVQLVDLDGELIYCKYHGCPIETVTDENGYYRLVGIPAGEYRVKITPPVGYQLTVQDADGAGVGGGSNSTPDPVDGLTPPFSLAGGEHKLTIDAGLTKTSKIGDRVWLDVNGDGIQDPLEPGVNGVKVYLYDGSGNPVLDRDGQPMETVTANDPATGKAGYYGFGDVPAGDYQVRFELPVGEEFTIQDADSAGVLGNSNSDANPATGYTSVFSVGHEEWITSIDAGLISKTTMTKSSDAEGSVEPGQTIQYTIEVENNSSRDQTDVAIWDAMPAGTTYVPGSLQVELTGQQYLMGSQTFSVEGNHTYTVPAGVTEVQVEAWGSGGGGSFGYGGGGGAYAAGTVSVTPGSTVSVVVGRGTTSSNAAGNDSYFGTAVVNRVVAQGGGGAIDGSAGVGGGARGSFVPAGGAIHAGGSGGLRYDGTGSNYYGGGGGGAGSAESPGEDGKDAVNGAGGAGGVAGTGGGNGGHGGTSSNNDTVRSGSAPGGGGGGRAYYGSGSGLGARGEVRVSYYVDFTGELGKAPDLATGWTIPAGEKLTLTYEVTVDDPVSVNKIYNLASFTSSEHREPIYDDHLVPVDEQYLSARLYGYTYQDADKSLTHSKGDGAANGMLVELWLDGVKVGETNSDENGFYEFNDLEPGEYEVRFYGSLAHLTEVPGAEHNEHDNIHRNRALPYYGDSNYGVTTYYVYTGHGMNEDAGEPVNAGFTGTGPLSSGIDLRAYATAGGVYVEFIAYDVEADDWMTLYLLDSKGNVIWFGNVKVVAGTEQFVRFKVPGLEAGNTYDFAVRDEVGKVWWADGINVGTLTTEMIAMTNQGVVLSFNSLPERSYAIEWTARLGEPWQLVTGVTAVTGRTTVVVQPLDKSATTGFFRVVLQSKVPAR